MDTLSLISEIHQATAPGKAISHVRCHGESYLTLKTISSSGKCGYNEIDLIQSRTSPGEVVCAELRGQGPSPASSVFISKCHILANLKPGGGGTRKWRTGDVAVLVTERGSTAFTSQQLSTVS